jgi:hypothetical protein
MLIHVMVRFQDSVPTCIFCVVLMWKYAATESLLDQCRNEVDSIVDRLRMDTIYSFPLYAMQKETLNRRLR